MRGSGSAAQPQTATDSAPHSHPAPEGRPVGGTRVGAALQLPPHKDSIWGYMPPSHSPC